MRESYSKMREMRYDDSDGAICLRTKFGMCKISHSLLASSRILKIRARYTVRSREISNKNIPEIDIIATHYPDAEVASLEM